MYWFCTIIKEKNSKLNHRKSRTVCTKKSTWRVINAMYFLTLLKKLSSAVGRDVCVTLQD